MLNHEILKALMTRAKKRVNIEDTDSNIIKVLAFNQGVQECLNVLTDIKMDIYSVSIKDTIIKSYKKGLEYNE